MTTIEDAMKVLVSTMDLPAEQVARMLDVPVSLVQQARVKVSPSVLIDAEMLDWRARCGYCDSELIDAQYQIVRGREVHDRCAEQFSKIVPEPAPVKPAPITPAQYKSRQRARDRLAKRCQRCGIKDERTLRGMINCEPCAEHEARRQVGMRRKRKGQCYRCGKIDDRTKDTGSCWDCADRAQRRRAKTRVRRRTR